MTTWMVVEDESDLYDLIISMFDVWGVDGVPFADGDEAVAWIDAIDKGYISGDLPSLALLDLRLPTISGDIVGERIRKSPRLKNTAIVLMTAYELDQDSYDEVMARSGADELLMKPLPHMETLHKVLQRHVDRRQALAQPPTLANDQAQS